MYKNGALEFFNHTEGIVEHEADGYKYVYQFKDHLGNIRLSYKDSDKNGSITQSEIVQEKNYYPFGLEHEGYNTTISGRKHNYGYNGIELNEDLGLYEMDLRQYDPAIARWTGIDPVTHHSNSTYNGFDNNPVFWADPSGADSETQGNKTDVYGRSRYDENGKYIPANERRESTGSSSDNIGVSHGNSQSKEGGSETNSGGNCCDDDPPESLWAWFKSLFNYNVTSEEEYEEREHNRAVFDLAAERAIIAGETALTYQVELMTLPIGGPGKISAGKNGIKVFSAIFSSRLQKIALKLDRTTLKGINHLLDQVTKGNINPGIGNNVIKSGNNVIFREFRHKNGARIYFQNTKNGIEILGYSNKALQNKVINLIKNQHGF